MKTKKIVLMFLITLSVFSSCRKDKPAADTESIKSLFSQLREPSQFFTISATATQTVTGTKGTKLTFYSNSFVTKTGQPVTGNVQIELKEIYSRGDMIRSNYTTTSNGMLLGSGGELLVRATQSGQELVMQTQYLVKMPGTYANYNAGMQVFYGELLPNASTGDSTMNWSPADSSASTIWRDTSGTCGGIGDFCYNFYADSLGFMNCDFFYSYSPLTAIHVTCNDTFNGGNCNVFVAFPTFNCVTSNWDVDRNGVFDSGGGYEAPVGLSATIVAIALVNGQYYSAIVPITVAAGGNYSVTLTPTTLADFEAALDLI